MTQWWLDYRCIYASLSLNELMVLHNSWYANAALDTLKTATFHDTNSVNIGGHSCKMVGPEKSPRVKWQSWHSDTSTLIARFMGLRWVPPGSCRPQMGPILAPWTLLSRYVSRGNDIGWFLELFYYYYQLNSAILTGSLELHNTNHPTQQGWRLWIKNWFI